MLHAFTDKGDGLYQVEVAEGEDLPEWTLSLTAITADQAQTLIAPPSFDQAIAFQRLRDVRALILNALTGVGLDAVAASDTATLAGVVAARQGLKDAPKDAGILAATSDEAFDLAAKTLYARLVIAAPATVRLAFKDVS